MGRDSVVGIATRYGLGGPGSNPGGGEIFRIIPDRPRCPLSLLYNGYRVSFLGVKGPGCGLDHPPHLAPRLKKEESYSYGTSWPVLGWNLFYFICFTCFGSEPCWLPKHKLYIPSIWTTVKTCNNTISTPYGPIRRTVTIEFYNICRHSVQTF
jgi:hypothetical protein